MLIGLLLNWGYSSQCSAGYFVWPGGIVAGWAVAVGTMVVLALMMLFRVLRRTW